MNTNVPRFGILLLCSAFASFAAAAPNLADLERRIERGSSRADATLVEAATRELDAALASDANSPALLYLRGYVAIAAANVTRARNDDAAVAARLEEALGFLERVTRGEPWAAEAMALASSVYGQLMGLKGGAASMTLGPKSIALLEAASSAAPRSPRILYFRAVARFATPPEWGGSRAEGLKLAEEAVAAFAAQDPSVGGPTWGHADALTWLGVMKQQTGDIDGARAAWTQVLALEPEYAWVKYLLLPSLK